MTLVAGQRVALVTDLTLGEAFGDGEAAVGFLRLAAGVEGTVEQVVEVPPSDEVREYQRLRALFDDYGHTMPAESRKALEGQIASLEPHWEAYGEHGPQSSVRVRFDNGYVLDTADETVLTAL
ncbi:hypothetical protein ACIQF6_29455 [Kitasatospora sp. NPDC092948]|uniref:hypothetical protein n=1 Tax=Kitasatospora sp. NPDC092948 TaxID=3364088 RepID=UPI0037F581B7